MNNSSHKSVTQVESLNVQLSGHTAHRQYETMMPDMMCYIRWPTFNGDTKNGMGRLCVCMCACARTHARVTCSRLEMEWERQQPTGQEAESKASYPAGEGNQSGT